MESGEEESLSYEEFKDFAKHSLCREYRTLWKDPIWDTYTDEELLIEYFALMFEKSEDFKRKFEATMQGAEYSEASDWFEEAIAANKSAIDAKLQETESIEFSPKDVK